MYLSGILLWVCVLYIVLKALSFWTLVVVRVRTINNVTVSLVLSIYGSTSKVIYGYKYHMNIHTLVISVSIPSSGWYCQQIISPARVSSCSCPHLQARYIFGSHIFIFACFILIGLFQHAFVIKWCHSYCRIDQSKLRP